MKYLLFILSTLFAYNGFPSVNAVGTALSVEQLTASKLNLAAGMSVIQYEQRIAEPEEAEKPKKEKKIIKGLIYYLAGGFVLLLIGMIFFIRKKPKQA